MAKLVCLLLLAVISVVSSRHIHAHRHHHGMRDSEDVQRSTISDIDGVPLEVIRNAKPSLVPVNNMLFFKRYDVPCEDGYKRDIFGVCREVWD